MSRKTLKGLIRYFAKSATVLYFTIASDILLGTGISCESGIYAPFGPSYSSRHMIGVELSLLVLDCGLPYILHENPPTESRKDVSTLGLGIYVDYARDFRHRKFSSFGPEFIWGFIGFDAGLFKENHG